MKITRIDTTIVDLPFRFAFAHSLASRSRTANLLVAVTLENGIKGIGESVPRDYVTGEDAHAAQRRVQEVFGPTLVGEDFSDTNSLLKKLRHLFRHFELDKQSFGAAWCALELAILDAYAKSEHLTVIDLIGKQKTAVVHYGGVVPFGGKKAVLAMLLFYKLYGFKTVKIKVGRDAQTDLDLVRLSRKILGPDVVLRVDANCAWDYDATMRAIEQFAPYSVSSIEQPVPANDTIALEKICKSSHVDIIVDESLCTLEQAEALATGNLCSAFNIRISKVGGFLAAMDMAELAHRSGLKVHMGAQVGESAILSAAGRMFAMMHEPFANCEGSMNNFLLKEDICKENLTVKSGGKGDLSYMSGTKHGFGLTLKDDRIHAWAGNLCEVVGAAPGLKQR